MRLTCPNCRAQYEVADSAIPARGRDVQCSSCGHGWFQVPDSAAEARPDGPTTAPDATRTKPPPTPPADLPRVSTRVSTRVAPHRDLDPVIADVLRAEAEREAQQRRRETADLVEEQQEFALADAPQSATDPTTDTSDTGVKSPEPASFAQARQADVPRRDLLPDIEEINSSLRAKTLAKASAVGRLTEDEVVAQERNGRGFRLGFATVLLIALFAVLLYAYAPTIIVRIPATEPFLESYVTEMNAGRLWLNGRLLEGSAWLRDLLEGVGG